MERRPTKRSRHNDDEDGPAHDFTAASSTALQEEDDFELRDELEALARRVCTPVATFPDFLREFRAPMKCVHIEA